MAGGGSGRDWARSPRAASAEPAGGTPVRPHAAQRPDVWAKGADDRPGHQLRRRDAGGLFRYGSPRHGPPMPDSGIRHGDGHCIQGPMPMEGEPSCLKSSIAHNRLTMPLKGLTPVSNALAVRPRRTHVLRWRRWPLGLFRRQHSATTPSWLSRLLS